MPGIIAVQAAAQAVQAELQFFRGANGTLFLCVYLKDIILEIRKHWCNLSKGAAAWMRRKG